MLTGSSVLRCFILQLVCLDWRGRAGCLALEVCLGPVVNKVTC